MDDTQPTSPPEFFVRHADPDDVYALHNLRMDMWRNSPHHTSETEPNIKDTLHAMPPPWDPCGFFLVAVSLDDAVALRTLKEDPDNDGWGVMRILPQHPRGPETVFTPNQVLLAKEGRPLKDPGVLLGAALLLPLWHSRPAWRRACKLQLLMPVKKDLGEEKYQIVSQGLVREAVRRLERRDHPYFSIIAEISCHVVNVDEVDDEAEAAAEVKTESGMDGNVQTEIESKADNKLGTEVNRKVDIAARDKVETEPSRNAEVAASSKAKANTEAGVVDTKVVGIADEAKSEPETRGIPEIEDDKNGVPELFVALKLYGFKHKSNFHVLCDRMKPGSNNEYFLSDRMILQRVMPYEILMRAQTRGLSGMKEANGWETKITERTCEILKDY